MADRATPGPGINHTLGAFSIGSSNLTFSKGPNVTSGTASVTITSLDVSAGNDNQPVTLNGDATIFVGTAGVISNAINKRLQLDGVSLANTVTGVISNGPGANTLSLIKANTSTWTLLGANTYTGSTTISGGTLQIGNGTIDGTISGSSSIVNSAALVFNTAATPTNASAISGTGTVTKIGAGTLILAGASNYTGPTTISTGTLQFGNGTKDGSLSGTSSIVNNAALTFNTTGTGSNTSTISGTGTLTKFGAGTLTLGGSNTYTGITTVNAGTLQFSKPVALYNSGTASWTAANLNVAPGAILAFNVGGSNDFTAANIDTFAALGTGSNGFRSGAILGLDPTNATGNIFAYTSAIANPNGGANALGIAKLGSNGLTLSGNNSYSGGTTVKSGTLTVGGANALGSGTGSLTVSAALDLGAYSVSAGSVALTGGTIANGTLSGTSFFSSGGNIATNLAGTGGFTQAGGVTTLTGTSAYSGPTAINSGTFAVTKTAALYNSGTANWTAANLIIGFGASAIFNVGGTGEFTSAHIDALAALGTGSNGFQNGATLGFDTTNAAGNNFAYASNIPNPNGGANALGITKLGSNTLTLSGSNTYTGPTTVKSGTLQVNGASALGSGPLTVSGGALNLGGNSFAVSSITAANATIANGTLSGTGGFTQTGGDVTLNTVNTYSGATIINAGRLIFSGSTSLLNNASGLAINGAGTTVSALYGTSLPGAALILDDSTNAAGNSTDHFGTTPITLNGGGINYKGNTNAVSDTTIQTLNIPAFGFVTVQPSGANADLKITNLTTGSNTAVTFISQSGTLGAGSNSGYIHIAGLNGALVSNTNGIIGGWATVSSYGINSSRTDFATYDATNGLRAVTYNGTTVAGAASTANINSAGETITSSTTVNSFASNGNDVILSNTAILTVNSGGVILGGNTHWIKGGGNGDGRLTAGAGSNYKLFFTVNDSSTNFQLNWVPVIDNGSNKVTFIKTGVGQLIISGGNNPTYTGGTVVDGGTLQYTNANALQGRGSATINPGGTILLANGITSHIGTLTLNGGTLASGTPDTTWGTWLFDNPVTVTGTGLTNTISAVNLTGNQTFTVNSGVVLNIPGTFGMANTVQSSVSSVSPTFAGSGLTILSGSSQTAGTFTLTSGSLRVANTNALGQTAVAGVALNGGTLDLNGYSVAQGTVTVSGGLLTNGSISATGWVASGGTIAASITGTSGFTQSGIVALTGSNSYSGPTNIGGWLTAANSNALGTGTVNIVSGGNMLELNNGAVVANPVVVASGVGVTGNGHIQAITGGTSTYSGTLTLNANPTAGGVFASLDGATLQVANANINAPAGVIVTIRTGTVVFSNVGGNYGQIAATNGATAVLGGNNGVLTSSTMAFSSYSGTWDLNGYNQSIAALSDSNLGSYAVIRNNNNGTQSTLTLAAAVPTNFGGSIVNNTNSGTGTVALVKSGSAMVILTGVNSYSGGTTITNGLLKLNNAAALGATTAPVTITGGTLDLLSSSPTIGALSGSTGAFITNSGGSTSTLTSNFAGSAVFSGSIANGASAVALTKAGSGTLLLNGTSSYTGATTISGGILAVTSLADGGSPSSIGSSSNTATNLSLYSGTLQYTGTGSSTNRQIYMGATATIDASGSGPVSFTNGAAVAFSSSLSRTLTLTGTSTADNRFGPTIIDWVSPTTVIKEGPGTWHLTTQSGFSGPLIVNAGILQLAGNATQYVSGTTTVNAGATVAVDPGTTDHIRYVVLNGGTLTSGTAHPTWGTFCFDSGIAATGGVTSTISAVAMTGNVSTIPVTIDAGSTLNISGGFGWNSYNPALTFSGSGLAILSGSNSTTGLVTIAGGTLQIGNGGTTGSINTTSYVDNSVLAVNRSDTVTLSTVVSGTGILSKAGTNTLIITAANTYSGGTVVNGGTLQLGNGSVAGSLGVGPITNNAVLAFNTGTNTVSLSGGIGGTGWVLFNSPGTVALAAAGSYTGGSTINAGGTVQIASTSSFGAASSPVTFAGSGGTVQLAPGFGSGTASRPYNLNASATFDTNGAGNTLALTGTITGSAALTKKGAGTLALNGVNSLTGPISINGGALALDSATLGANTVSVAAGGKLNATGTSSIGGVVTVAGNGGSLSSNGAIDLTGGSGLNTLSFTGSGTVLTVGGSQAGQYSLLNVNVGPGNSASFLDLGSATLQVNTGGLSVNPNALPGATTGSATIVSAGNITNYSAITTPVIYGQTAGAFALATSATNVILNWTLGSNPDVVYWNGGLSNGLGSVWFVASGSTNWTGDAAGLTAALVPGANSEIHLSSTNAANLSSQSLGANGTVKSIIFDSTNTGSVSVVDSISSLQLASSGTAIYVNNPGQSLTLAVALTGSGATVIDSGTLQIGNGGVAGALPTGPISGATGALLYKLNDNYPAVSWATADWYGATKLSHWFVQDAFAPVSAVVLFESVNNVGKPLSLPVFLLDDRSALGKAAWRVRVRAFDGTLQQVHEKTFDGHGAVDQGRRHLGTFDLTADQTQAVPLLIVSEVETEGHQIQRTFYFVNYEAKKDSLFDLPATTLKLSTSNGAAQVTNTGHLPAVGVLIDRPGHADTFHASDNCFWLDAGESNTIEVNTMDGLTVSAWNAMSE